MKQGKARVDMRSGIHRALVLPGARDGDAVTVSGERRASADNARQSCVRGGSAWRSLARHASPTTVEQETTTLTELSGEYETRCHVT